MQPTIDTPATSSTPVTIRSLAKEDLDAVVALDRRITGSSRRGYFERRLAAALRHPARHLQLAATTTTGLVGFMLARTALGEYGRVRSAGVLEAVGVDPSCQRCGVGRGLTAALEERLAARDIGSLITQVDWRNHPMLRFLDGAGLLIAQRHVLAREVMRMPLPATDEEVEAMPPVVRHLRMSDFDAVARIDRSLTGRDRSAYLQAKFDEVLQESAITVSLVAEDDGYVAAFAMARVDLGDFGHVAPAASLDTIGVHPDLAHRGFARALLGQMVDNLSALHVEALETEVSRDAFALLRFLYDFGFKPSQRLAFERHLAPRVAR